MKNHPNTKISPLFEGEKSYVHSVTTLATPTVQHLRMVVFYYRSLRLLITAASFGGNDNLSLYDFKLDQWGIKKNVGESFSNTVIVF